MFGGNGGETERDKRKTRIRNLRARPYAPPSRTAKQALTRGSNKRAVERQLVDLS